MRPKKRSALIKPSLLLEAASHPAMGVAVGLAFAFLVTHVTALGIATLINYSLAQDAVMLMFVGTCAISLCDAAGIDVVVMDQRMPLDRRRDRVGGG